MCWHRSWPFIPFPPPPPEDHGWWPGHGVCQGKVWVPKANGGRFADLRIQSTCYTEYKVRKGIQSESLPEGHVVVRYVFQCTLP